MSKYKPGDRFMVEITGVDNEASFHGYPHTTYKVKGADCFSENVLDKLERIEPPMAPRTNRDKLHTMSDGELAGKIWCPYVESGALPCMDEDLDSKGCLECRKEWLQRIEPPMAAAPFTNADKIRNERGNQ